MDVVTPVEREERNRAVRYEVHRMRATGRLGVEKPPIVEVFLGLDRARLSALTHALDGTTQCGDRFTGLVHVFEVFYQGEYETKRALIDSIDERVASRILNETRLPRADQLSVDIESFKSELNFLVL